LLVIAALRFGRDVARSIQAAELPPPDDGFVVGFSTDCVTLSIGVVGVLRFALAFRAPRSRV
jgi:hypothetical protein